MPKSKSVSKAQKPVPRKPRAGQTVKRAAASAPGAGPERVTPEERRRMIGEAAYYIALRRGFNSDPRENWMAAESEIDAKLKASGRV